MTPVAALFRLPAYRYPPWATLDIALGVLAGRPRSLARDAHRLASGISSLRVEGNPQALFTDGGRAASARGLLFTFNHYSRPGFQVWWIPIALASVVPCEMHWVMATAWTYPDWLRSHTLTPLSTWLFHRLARAYGFTPMPPMPPRPWELAARANAVREVLRWARAQARPVIGLAPEGMDPPPGKMMMPPAGVGRFIDKLARLGLAIVPVGAYEEGGALCLNFGRPYLLGARAEEDRDMRDGQVGHIVMQHIAERLPSHLRSFAETRT